MPWKIMNHNRTSFCGLGILIVLYAAAVLMSYNTWLLTYYFQCLYVRVLLTSNATAVPTARILNFHILYMY